MATKIPLRPVRMEDELYQKVCFIADLEERSCNAEIVYILKQFVQQYEAKHGPIQIPSSGPEQ